MKIHYIYKITLLLTALALSSCVKDTLYNTSHPDKGTVVVQMDFSNLPPEAAAESYVINVDGVEQALSGSTAEWLTEPGEHTLMIYNRPDGITISNGIASVNEETGTRATGFYITPHLGYLYAQAKKFNAVLDELVFFSTKPIQYVRQLDLKLAISESDCARITSIIGSLSGVERAVDIVNGERMSLEANAYNVFLIHPDGAYSHYDLMGIVPSVEQILTVNVILVNGGTQTIKSNLSEQLINFNNGNKPLTLISNLELPTQGEISASISDWKVVENGEVDIH